jgi:hypothetical protein
VLVRQLGHGSSLSRAQFGDAASWGVQEHLLAHAVDRLGAGNWQRGGGKGQRPKPVPRPGRGNSETYTGESVPLDEMKRRFAERREAWMAEAGEVG